MISFTDYALAVYPFLELEWFHRTYYRVLEAFAEGRVRRLMILGLSAMKIPFSGSSLLRSWASVSLV